jgi:hypothetical protein
MSSDVVGELGSVCVLFPTRRLMFHVPCGEGVHLPFIDQGEGELQACRTIRYMGKYGVQRRGVGGRLDGPRHDLVIMACLVPRTVAASRVGA